MREASTGRPSPKAESSPDRYSFSHTTLGIFYPPRSVTYLHLLSLAYQRIKNLVDHKKIPSYGKRIEILRVPKKIQMLITVLLISDNCNRYQNDSASNFQSTIAGGMRWGLCCIGCKQINLFHEIKEKKNVGKEHLYVG